MGLCYQETFTVPFDMTDVRQEINIPQFLSYCLAVSGRQSEQINRSDMEVFKQYGFVWVVTDYQLHIQRLPRYNETIVIETEAVAYNKFFCFRKFVIRGEAAEHLMEILCYFVLLDFKTRKVVPVPDELIAPYQSEKVKKLPRMAKYTELQSPLSKDYAVRYFDIDMNGHVNNSKYLEWMYEALDYDFLFHHSPSHIQLRFVKEVSPTGFISSQWIMEDKKSRHEIYSDGHIHAQAFITWRER